MTRFSDFADAFEHENNFYLTSHVTRISKILAHYELYKMSLDLPGAIVECGVFKGASLIRLATFRELFENSFSRPVIGFDAFGEFPDTVNEEDDKFREKFESVTGEDEGIAVDQLHKVLNHKGIDENIELVQGDVRETIPAYCKSHPELKIALLNLDTCTYDSCKVILECLYPRIVSGGVVILDDYGAVAGETIADDEFFKDLEPQIKKFRFSRSPCYLIKN